VALLAAGRKGEVTRTAVAIAIVLLGFAVYLFGLLATYLTNMSMFEAAQIGYFDRFVSVYLAGMSLFTIGLLRANLSQKAGAVALCLVLLLCAATAPKKSWHNLAVKQAPQSKQRLDLIARIGPVVPHIPEAARVYIIWSGSNGYEYWMTRFELIPRAVNHFCWAVALEPAEDDLYTCRKSVDQWSKELEQFDFVLLAHRNERFEKQYMSLFAPPVGDAGGSLFKIEKVDDRPLLSKVR
jgi:hypothetical protein